VRARNAAKREYLARVNRRVEDRQLQNAMASDPLCAEIGQIIHESKAMKERIAVLTKEIELERGRVGRLNARKMGWDADIAGDEEFIAEMRAKIRAGFKCSKCGFFWREACSVDT
jgi:hypothetical protein